MPKKRQAPIAPDRITVRALSMRYSHGTVLGDHAHDWHQLLYASKGVMLVETDASSWVVPPHRGVWLQANVPHRVTMRGEVAMKSLYFRGDSRDPHFADKGSARPATTCVVDVSPLLRELIVYCAARGKLDESNAHDARLAGLLDDLLGAVPAAPLALPMPRDRRALRIAERVRRDTKAAAASTIPDLARSAGASLRTIERLFLAETGMTFGRWRQQARLLHALTLLAEGASVTAVALDVGYASTSAFIAMFKSSLGTTPSRLLSSEGRS